ncbi:hypothetical protein CALVIDRAFT_64895 [Calocera viscosa TUFC12733]|uniref:Uncharacterized protein n=1 Tax=Calocera viscosa (strain TUFC12733) TaxID=1330018 RepID=A0A167NPL1_CALVF|nr:hypothetical protein CALVIDRAFT_64895 [Calocera viscosa TUFC12733]
MGRTEVGEDGVYAWKGDHQDRTRGNKRGVKIQGTAQRRVYIALYPRTSAMLDRTAATRLGMGYGSDTKEAASSCRMGRVNASETRLTFQALCRGHVRRSFKR